MEDGSHHNALRVYEEEGLNAPSNTARCPDCGGSLLLAQMEGTPHDCEHFKALSEKLAALAA